MNNFILFGTQHLAILGSGILIGILLIMIGFFLDRKHFARFTAVLVLIIKVVELLYRHIVNGEPVIGLLPLHLCNIVLVFVVIMMITGSKKLFQPCYYWSLGAIFALMTPDIKDALPNYVTLSFFITHFYIVFGVIYAYIFFNYRPTLIGYFSSFISLNIIALIVYFINRELGTNYLFVNRVPTFTSPLAYFGAWPYYIVVVELIYIILTYIIYFPFRAKNVKYGRVNFYK